MRVIFTTTNNKQKAKKLAKKIIKNKLAKCIQITKIDSIYEYENKLYDEKEFLLIIKTSKKFKKVCKFIKKHHNYKLPEIISLDIKDGYNEYLKYLYQ